MKTKTFYTIGDEGYLYEGLEEAEEAALEQFVDQVLEAEYIETPISSYIPDIETMTWERMMGDIPEDIAHNAVNNMLGINRKVKKMVDDLKIPPVWVYKNRIATHEVKDEETN